MIVEIPYSSFYSDERKILRQGNSYMVTIPSSFVRAVKTLQDRKLKLINIDNTYLIYFASVLSSDDVNDLLQITLHILEALNTVVKDNTVITEVYQKLANLQESQSK